MSLSDQSENGAAVTSARHTSGIAEWLCLAAAPAFAIMALLTAITGGADMICSSTPPGAFTFDGMVTMYLLMSAFHLPPWLRLISGRSDWALQERWDRLARHWRRWNWPKITNG